MTYGRPLKVSKNLLPNENENVILPFHIKASSEVPVINKVFNKDGVELSDEK
jgi:hypothetical protein